MSRYSSTAATAAEVFADDVARQGFRDTEREIWADITGTDERDPDGNFVDGMSEQHGWNDEPLGLNEIAAVNLNGHGELNNDRPLETLDAAELRAEHAKMRGMYDAIMQLYQRDYEAPQREQQKQQLREQARSNLMDRYGMYDSLDDAKFDRFLSDVGAAQAQTADLEQQRIHRSFDDARAQFGDKDFFAVYNRVMGMRATPTSVAMVNEIQSAENPGLALMSLHGSDMVEMLQHRRAPPFVNRGSRQPMQRKGHAPGGHIGHDLLGGWGDSDTEQNVMDSVWGDD
jgi:hypothetical protein